MSLPNAPLPAGTWIGHQSWNDLLLAHWPVPAEALRPHVPEVLEIDTHGGSAWLSLVPFRMRDVRPRWAPPLLGLSFPELNVRTYVRSGGRAGVFFFSLDASNRAAVAVGRRAFGLPYSSARMTFRRTGQVFRFESTREGGAASFQATFEPGAALAVEAGSREAWLLERYCFYARRPRDRVIRCDVHHRPWTLRQCAAEIRTSGLGLAGVDLLSPPALVHFSPGVDVRVWPPRLVR